MNLLEHVVSVANSAGLEFFRYAAATDPGKQDWKPLEQGQSVLSMAREIACTPGWALDVLADRKYTEEQSARAKEEIASWSTIEECRAQFESRFAEWSEFVLALTESQLSQSKWLPFNGGRDHSYLELLEYVRWNCTYHTGQVAYIQTLYGDRDIH